jgi:hypothetical protein
MGVSRLNEESYDLRDGATAFCALDGFKPLRDGLDAELLR